MESIDTLQAVARTMSTEDLRRDQRACSDPLTEQYDPLEYQTVLGVVTQELVRRSIEEQLTKSWKQIKTSMKAASKTIDSLYTNMQNMQNISKSPK